jgi:DNA-binding CsgD family transcriptional regulator
VKDQSQAILLEPLTARELEILRLIARGLSNRAIAERLVVSVETVKWYNKRLYAKLDVSSRTQAVASARQFGLLREPSSQPEAAPFRHHLPAPLTSFLGREQDVRAVRRLLQTNRLVTLTGPLAPARHVWRFRSPPRWLAIIRMASSSSASLLLTTPIR